MILWPFGEVANNNFDLNSLIILKLRLHTLNSLMRSPACSPRNSVMQRMTTSLLSYQLKTAHPKMNEWQQVNNMTKLGFSQGLFFCLLNVLFLATVTLWLDQMGLKPVNIQLILHAIAGHAMHGSMAALNIFTALQLSTSAINR